MVELLRDAWLVCAKDLRLEWRTRVAMTHVAPFVLTVVMIFAFALDVDSDTLERATSGVYWVTVVFAATLLVQRTSMVERPDGLVDAVRLSGLSPAGWYLGKTAALLVLLAAVEILLGVAVVVFYGITLSGWALLISTALVATLAVAAAGSTYGPLAAGLAGRETVLPLLFLPVLAPVLLSATRAFEIALGRGVGGGWSWVALLGMLSVIYLGLGLVLAGPLLEES